MTNQHMTVAEYRAFNAQCTAVEYSPSKKTKVSDSDNPVEHIEAIKLKHALDDLVLEGKVITYAHLVNELKLNRRAGEKPSFAYLMARKAEGWKPGVPDYLIILKDKCVLIELKRCKGNKSTPDQDKWIEAINKAGGYACVCKGSQAAINYLERLL